jgi:tetratricopeptide (TPR) repeat protein
LHKPEEAYTSFRKAIEINPNNPNNLFALALLIHEFGLTDEAITLLDKAVKLDPLSAASIAFRGGYKLKLNRLDDATKDFQIALRLEPDMYYVMEILAQTYTMQTKLKEAKEMLEKSDAIRPPGQKPTIFAAYCYAKFGNKQKALEFSNESRTYLALNMKEDALKAMMSYRPHENPLATDYLELKAHLPHKDFDIVRDDPRFLELLEKKRKQYEINKKRFSVADLIN